MTSVQGAALRIRRTSVYATIKAPSFRVFSSILSLFLQLVFQPTDYVIIHIAKIIMGITHIQQQIYLADASYRFDDSTFPGL
jgi:hypothetical protein